MQKIDIGLILGTVIAWASVIICIILEEGHPASLMNLPAFILVFGGGVGATLIGYKFTEIPIILKIILTLFLPKKIEFEKTIEELKQIGIQARREGVLSLENSIAKYKDPYMKTGLQLIVDGADSEVIAQVLETKASILEAEGKIGENFFTQMGGYAPTIGILGCIIGLVKVLGNLSDPEKLGEGISSAFVATLYGIAFANLIFLPVGTKLKNNAAKEVVYYNMLLEGILSIQAGDNPLLLEEKLRAFMDVKATKGKKGEKKEAPKKEKAEKAPAKGKK